MDASPDTDRRRRLARIEDRKIEILMEIAEINREYDDRVSALREEYAELDSEYFILRFQRMTMGRPTAPLGGDGEP
jgi:hypothetical protein